jgi:multiple sugar transport system substrate-binding protein
MSWLYHYRCRAALALLSLVALASLAACKAGAEPAVSFMVFGDAAELAAYEELVGAFEEAHSEIDVALQHIPSQGEYRQRLAAAFSSGAPPDVMLINYRRFATFAGQGGLEPLTAYLEESDLIAEEDFFPVAIDSFQWAGQLWCIPQNVSSLVVYYNQDLFDAAGLAYPAADWSWTDFLAIAQALMRDVDGDGRVDQYGVAVEPSIFRLAPFIWQNGGRLVDDQEKPTRLTLDEPAALDAFQWFVELQTEHGVAPDAAAEAAEPAETRFLHGTLAMYFDSRRVTPTLRTINGFDWDVAPLPRGRREAGILHSDGYCLAAASDVKEDAWTLIEFANSPTGQAIIARSGRTVPSLTAVAESADFLDPALPPANSRVFVDTISLLQRVPTIDTWIAIEVTAGEEIERAFYGRISVEEAVRLVGERTRTYFLP